MDLTFLFLALVACLLDRVEAISSWKQSTISLHSFRSHFRRHSSCSGGNLIRIDTNQCEVSSAGKRQCKAKCNGASTKDSNARFMIVEEDSNRGRTCIQFNQNGTKYGLKIINGTNVAFEEQPRCNSTAGNDFLFESERVGKFFTYKYMTGTTSMCLGVSSDCGENLSLIASSNNQDTEDRRCLFRVLRLRRRH